MMQDDYSSTNDLHLPRYTFEPVIQRPFELERTLERDFTLCFVDLKGQHEVQTCCGDIYKIINALMDYSRLLEMVCDQWRLEGYHRAVYEYHAGKLREIADKYQAAIGYDYEKALEKCRKKQARQSRDDDIGDDALVQALRRRR